MNSINGKPELLYGAEKGSKSRHGVIDISLLLL
jgi:hypothetical protein